jgi:hypothetical protein
LPTNFSKDDIKILYQKNELPMVQWIYTGGDDAKYLYLIGGATITGSFVAKVDAITMDVLQKFQLKPALYIGGLLIHRNGNVYCMHANILYVFWGGNLSNVSSLRLPTNLNGNLVQTNGMLVTQDGYLVVKQWSLIMDDILLFASAKKSLISLFYALLIVCTTIAFYRKSLHKNFTVRAAVRVVAVGLVTGSCVFIGLCMLLFAKLLGSFNPVTYLTSNTLFYGGGGGELKIIHPTTLEVVAQISLTERCSFARMALVSVSPEEAATPAVPTEDAIVLLGDEHVYQLRWRPSEKALFLIPSWTKKYRGRGEGTFPGTGPAIFGNVAYFTDNTFPVFLKGHNYKLFSLPLGITSTGSSPDGFIDPQLYVPSAEIADVIKHSPLLDALQYRPPVVPRLVGAALTDAASPTPSGFMFWSVVVSVVL